MMIINQITLSEINKNLSSLRYELADGTIRTEEGSYKEIRDLDGDLMRVPVVLSAWSYVDPCEYQIVTKHKPITKHKFFLIKMVKLNGLISHPMTSQNKTRESSASTGTFFYHSSDDKFLEFS